jgi:starvation-inducible DNA-binding protein
MRDTRNSLKENVRGKSVVLLGAAIIHALDLERQAKQAHWNVRGQTFMALHELFDRVADEARGYSDEAAERLVALGGEADGRPASIANRSTLKPYPAELDDERAHVQHLADALATFGGLARSGIDDAAGWGDQGTADLLTGMSRGLDKLLWMVGSHLGRG